MDTKEIMSKAHAALSTPEYDAYHKQVVEIGVDRLGEDSRRMWESMSYEMEFVEGTSVQDCVEGNIEAMEDSQ